MIECDGLSEKDLGFLGENTEDEKLNIINQLFSKADLAGTSVRKSISNMTEGYDYYDTEVMLCSAYSHPKMVLFRCQQPAISLLFYIFQ